jgi:uncharacterized protein
MIDTDTIEALLQRDYASKDIMHGLSHIRRLLSLARDLGSTHPHNPDVLMFAAYCHGVVYSKETEMRSFLAQGGVGAEMVDRAIKASWESRTEGIPETIEGALLHDAHLLEGGKTFIIAKSLVTGTARGQTIDETIRFIEEQVLGRFRCALPKAQAAYEEKEAYARDFIADLKGHLAR